MEHRGSGKENMRERNETRGYHARRRVEDLFCHRMLPTSSDEDHANICPLSPGEHDRKMHVNDMLQNMLQYVCLSVCPPAGFESQVTFSSSLTLEVINQIMKYNIPAEQLRPESCPGHHDPASLSYITNPTWS